MYRKRTKIEREADLSRIGSLHIQGLSQREIAEAVGLSQPQVGRELREIQKRWAKEDFSELRKIRNQELMKLGELERVSWVGLRDSGRDKETRSQEKVTSARPESNEGNTATRERLKASLRSEVRDGNPDWVKAILACMDRRAKLLGLYDPQQLEKRADEKPIQFIRVIVRERAGQAAHENGQHEKKPSTLLSGPESLPAFPA